MTLRVIRSQIYNMTSLQIESLRNLQWNFELWSQNSIQFRVGKSKFHENSSCEVDFCFVGDPSLNFHVISTCEVKIPKKLEVI